MATIAVRGKSWVLNWRDTMGVRHRRRVGPRWAITRTQARDILRAKELELAGLGAPPSIPSFFEWAVEYILWHALEYPHSHGRILRIIEQHLAPRFGKFPLNAIPVALVQEYKRERALENAKSATVLKEFRTLKAIINRAIACGVIRDDPIAQVKAPRVLDSKPHRFYSVAELQRLYEATKITVNGGSANPDHALWWRLLANTGMRKAEAEHLRWRDVGHDGVRIVSTEGERTKSGRWRDVPLSQGASEAIDELRELRGNADYVLPRVTSLSRCFARDAARAQLDGSLHTLRHTYISHLVLAGTPMRTVQLYAGHSTVNVTEQYAYLIPDRVSAAVRTLRL